LIKKALIYFSLLTAALYGLRELHYEGLLRQDEGFYGKFKTIFLKKNSYNLLFLGSSRVEMHYDPQIIDSICGSNSYNLGTKGATPRVAWAVLKAYLSKSAVPSAIVYDVDYHFLKYQSEEVKEFNNYFPFLNNKILLEEFSKIDPRMRHFYMNPYYSWPYTGLKNISTSLHGWTGVPNKTDSLYYKGFLKESFLPELKFKPARPAHSWFHPTERAYLDSVIQYCKKNSVQLHLLTSPMFAGGRLDVKNKDQIVQQLKNMASANGLRYYDLSSLPFCDRRGLFTDHFHMNRRGAREFSLYLARSLNNKEGFSALK
jgi:hypothetical protein